MPSVTAAQSEGRKDLESQSEAQPSHRKLHACLLASVVLLFASVAALALVLSFVLLEEQNAASRHLQIEEPEAGSAHLTTRHVKVEPRTMEWIVTAGMGNVLLGAHFLYNDTTHSLQILKDGVYFIYAQLELRCVAEPCNSNETVTLAVTSASFNRIMEVEILLMDSKDVNMKFSATLFHLHRGDELSVKLETKSKSVINEWQMDQKRTYFGAFRNSRDTGFGS
nr:PREDICTED: uncharacterized protein LOC102360292 [Latimeria chalumnae]|eukprot:XP_006013567.1 PREDICTED: uncharacterized protein LOC102360292 [Latimeria chalumnae]